MDRDMKRYNPSPELLHACLLMMNRLKDGDPNTLLVKDHLQHVVQWLNAKPALGIPDSARHRLD
jgi:hypothetical protein